MEDREVHRRREGDAEANRRFPARLRYNDDSLNDSSGDDDGDAQSFADSFADAELLIEEYSLADSLEDGELLRIEAVVVEWMRTQQLNEERSVRQFLEELRRPEHPQGPPSLETLVRVLADDGGRFGNLLWSSCTDEDKTVFQACLETLSPAEMEDFLELILSNNLDLPADRGPDLVSLLHLAIESGAPPGLLRFLANKNPDSLHVPDDLDSLPVHKACKDYVHHRSLDVAKIQALVDANREVLEVRDCNGRLPLHLACNDLLVGGATAWEAIRWVIEAFPGALSMRDIDEWTPIILALEAIPYTIPPPPPPADTGALELLVEMVERAPDAVRAVHVYRFDDDCADVKPLHVACEWCPHSRELVSLLLATVGPNALQDRNGTGDLPLHCACLWFLTAGFSPDQQRAAVDVIRMLIDGFPQALDARNHDGMTPVMVALASADPNGSAVLSPATLRLLRHMIQLGGSSSLWGNTRRRWRQA
jgi:ankyrin repeat protein